MPDKIVLSALSRDPIPMEDDEGHNWLLVPNMKGIEAVRMMTNPEIAAQAQMGNRHELEWFALILSRSLKKNHPKMTPEAVLEQFAAAHIVEAVVSFLTHLSRVVSENRRAAQEASAAISAAQALAENSTRTATTSGPASG